MFSRVGSSELISNIVERYLSGVTFLCKTMLSNYSS